MVDIECLGCGEILKIPKWVNTDNYDGQIVCQKCKSLLYVKLVKGTPRKYKIVSRKKKEIELTADDYLRLSELNKGKDL